MRIRNTIVSLVLAASALVGSSAYAAVVITVGNATADQGGTATFDVTLSGVAGGAAANNAQIDIIFSSNVFDVSAGTVCTANARVANLRHTETLPTSPAVPADSKRLRLNIIDADGSGRVTDGVLYTCAFPVKADAPAGAATLDGGRVNVGDTAGNILASGDSAAVDGTVTVEGGAVACVVPTPNPTPASGVFITAGGVVQAKPGESATFSVTLAGVAAGGAAANNAQLDIIFPSDVFDVTAGTVCTANARVANLRHTETLPTSPAVPAGSKRLRLNIIDADGSGRVTDGELYSCTFPILAGAPEGTAVLDGGRVNVGDTAGNILASGDAAAVDGLVAVCAEGGGPTDTPTSTPTSTPTNTEVPPTVTPSNTPALTPVVPTNTPTRPLPTRTATQQPDEEDEDGCQMTSNASSNSWALFVPVMMVLALRRRAR